MRTGYRTEVGAADSHSWKGAELRLGAKQTLDNTISYRTYVLSTAPLGLAPGGWLTEAVNAAPNLLHFCDALGITQTLIKLAQTPQVITRLNTPIHELGAEDVHAVLKAIDVNASVARPSAPLKLAQQLRTFLTRPIAPINDGTSLCDVRYRTKLRPGPLSANNTLSDAPHPSLADPQLARPASAIQFEGLSDLAEKQLDHFGGRIDVLLQACVNVLDAHDGVIVAIRQARASGITGLAVPATIRKALERENAYQWGATATAEPEVQFRIAVHMLDAHQLHMSNSNVKLSLKLISEFNALLTKGTHEERFAVLLSETYLCRPVIFACFIILMLGTGWNKSTLLSLSKSRIKKINGGYRLLGLKFRSNQNEEQCVGTGETVNSRITGESQDVVMNGLIPSLLNNENSDHILSTSTEVRAIELLLRHRENVDKFGVYDSDSLFVSLILGEIYHRRFSLKFGSVLFNEFCRFIHHPLFRADDLRKQSNSYFYLASGKDIRATQARMNHGTPLTTMRYVDGTALRISHEAIMKDFADILSASFEYSAGRLVFNKDWNDRKTKLIKNLLLFPCSQHHAEDGKSVADKWLNSQGQFSFEIGTSELKQCVYQRQFYRRHTAKLIAANAQRFDRYHLPRLLFCEALHRVISASPLGGQLALLGLS